MVNRWKTIRSNLKKENQPSDESFFDKTIMTKVLLEMIRRKEVINEN
jgi:hypothetical protein